MVYRVASIYGEVSSNYIMTPLSEWSRISETADKNKDAIQADRKNVLQLCIEADSGIEKVLESEEETFPDDQRKTTGDKWDRNEF